jgi:uncharacterized protein DUF5615
VETIRLLLDEDVRPLLAEVLVWQGYDAIGAVAAGLSGSSDPAILVWATQHNRLILTHDVAGYPDLHAAYVSRGWEHAGIAVSNRVPFKRLLARTLHLLSRKSAEEVRTSLIWMHAYD